MDTERTRIPVTLLTGFLGAGKTTLLNHLIHDPEAGRIAVIMNEFGAAGLDHDVIEAATEETILMQSGCLCCTFRDDISKTLTSLMDHKRRGELSFDRIVIETTGIAEPAPILSTLVADRGIAQDFRMDGVVTVADAATGSATLSKHREAVKQVAMADLIVLSKTDLVSPDDLAAYEGHLDSINAVARRITADRGRVSPGALFGLSAMRENVGPEDLSHWLGTETSGHAHGHHHHHDRIVSSSIEVADPIPSTVFDFWLDLLIALKGPDILRIKGIVHVKDLEWPFVFHGVQHIFDAPVPLKTWAKDDTTSRIVVIARNLTKEELQESLNLLMKQLKDIAGPAHRALVEAEEIPF